jgi:hypothetical protein
MLSLLLSDGKGTRGKWATVIILCVAATAVAATIREPEIKWATTIILCAATTAAVATVRETRVKWAASYCVLLPLLVCYNRGNQVQMGGFNHTVCCSHCCCCDGRGTRG